MSDDITTILEATAPEGPSTDGWAAAARSVAVRRRKGMRAGLVAVGLASALAVGTLAGVILGPGPSAAPAAPLTTTAPSPRETDSRVVQTWEKQIEIAWRNVDVFAGSTVSTDGKHAILYYARHAEGEARRLTSSIAGEPGFTLIAREHSWEELMAQRERALAVAAERRIPIVEIVPDVEGGDGLVLLTERVNPDGSVGGDAGWAALRAAGVVEARQWEPEPPPMIRGFVLGRHAEPTDGVLVPPMWGGPAGALARRIGAVTSRDDIFGPGSISGLRDRLVLEVVQGRRAEAERLLAEAGLADEPALRLVEIPKSPAELHRLALGAMKEAQGLGLDVSGATADLPVGGVTLFLVDPHELEGLTDAQVAELRSAGVVSVEQMGKMIALGGPSPSGSPSPKR